MTAAASSSSAHRRLTLRARHDVEAIPQVIGGETVWALKDPVALTYFHLRDHEYWIFRRLDGVVSLADIQEQFAERFAPQRLALSELQTFLGTLHQAGLVVADAPGQGEELLRRAAVHTRQRLWQALANPLAIRFRGFDPERFLNRLAPVRRLLFSAPFLSACAALVLAAVVLVTTRFDVLQSRLPERDAFFGPRNLAWIAVTMALIKVVHELGHAMTLKRFGGECHEMGVMLLVFTPCLYCNVSDAWMLRSKWQRAAVGAAGIMVEMVLAAVCTFLWWFSEPGLFNTLCLNVMFVCSVSTLLINGNPLLRYDGYYVLADLVEIPNLSREANLALREAIARYVLGFELSADDEVSMRRRATLAAYAAASFVYRCVVLFGALWWMYKLLQPHRLEVFAEAAAVAVGAGLVLFPLWQFGRFLKHPYWRRKVLTRRAAVGGVAFVAVVGGLLSVPIPHRIAAPVVLQPADARRVYAAVAGRIESGVEEGASIRQGDAIASLVNSQLELEIEQVRGQRDRALLRVETLNRRQFQDNAAAAELPTAKELLADLEDRLKQKLVDQQRLKLIAPVDGAVLPPPRHDPQPARGSLTTWSGTPLDPRNQGCELESGTLVCVIGDPNRLEAVLVINQDDVDFVAVGQNVRIQLDQSPGSILNGEITEVAEIDLQVTPPELLAGGEVPTRPDERGLPRPASTSYQTRVKLAAAGQPLLIGESGRAKIDAAPLSLGRRLLRTINRTFGLDLPAA